MSEKWQANQLFVDINEGTSCLNTFTSKVDDSCTTPNGSLTFSHELN